MRKVYFLFIFALVLFSACIMQEEKNQNTNQIHENKENVVYLIYSPACPHCHAMIEYLKNYENEIKIVKTTQPKKYLSYLYKNFNFSWDGGVPLLFGIVENKTLIVIQGYPAKGQEKNGYFLGKEKEQKICENMNGEKIMINGDYKFCELPTGVILGNKYAIDYLINTCKTKGCTVIY